MTSFIEQHPAVLVVGAIGAGYFLYTGIQRNKAQQKVANDVLVPTNNIDNLPPQGSVEVFGQQPGTTYVSEEQLNNIISQLRDEMRNGIGAVDGGANAVNIIQPGGE